jgi:hypothetical protein
MSYWTGQGEDSHNMPYLSSLQVYAEVYRRGETCIQAKEALYGLRMEETTFQDSKTRRRPLLLHFC